MGGVGFELMCTPGTLATLRTGQTATLPTSMVVREDSLTLFGFLDDDEKVVFEPCRPPSGVDTSRAGDPRVPGDRRGARVAVASDDTKTLTRVPGIGQKGAQRIILELKDRLGSPSGRVRNGMRASAQAPWKDQVLQALVGLGWSAKDADNAVEAVAPEAGRRDPQVAGLLRSALRTLSKA